MQNDPTRVSNGAIIATNPILTPNVIRYVKVEEEGAQKFVRLGSHRFSWLHFFEVNKIANNDTAIQSK